MKIKLQLPYAEIYEIEYPQNCNKRNLAEYIEKQLKGLQPGFSSDSLWDYVVIISNNKKLIKVAVLDKSYYVEQRVKDTNIEFYIEENERLYTLFNNRKFTKTGQRKRSRIILFIILYCFIFGVVISLILVSNKTEKKSEVIIENTQEKEIPDICNLFDVLNFTAKQVFEVKGILTNINYHFDQNAKIVFVINNCEPFDLINRILVNTQIENCFCSNVTYKNNSECFELQIIVPIEELIIEQKTGLELLELQKKIVTVFRSEGIEVINSSIDQDFCKEKISLCVNRKELEKCNSLIENLLLDNNLFITSFNELNEENNLCMVEFETVLLNQEQKIKQKNEGEAISKIMYVAPEKIINKEEKRKITTIKEDIKKTEKINHKLTKIGSVVKNGVTIFYYRTEDGKLYTSEEEL